MEHAVNVGRVLEFPGVEKPRVHHGGASRGGANAITSREDILRIFSYFFNHENQNGHKSFGVRNYALVTFGFNSNLRAGDMLKLVIGDVWDTDSQEIKDEFIIVEEKTNKTKTVFMNDSMKKALMYYFETERPDFEQRLDEPLFSSRQRSTGEVAPITIQRYNQLLREVQEHLKLPGKISSHTCRKSWARGVYDSQPDDQKENALIKISYALNHSSIQQTMVYLDIRKEELRDLSRSYQISLL